MGKYKDFLNNKSFILPVNLITLRPCKEWVLLKMKFNGTYVKVALIINELEYRGVPFEDTAGVLTKIMQLSEKHSVERVVEIVERYVKSKRTDSGIDESV